MENLETIIEILEDIQPDADYETCTTLIEDHILSSLMIISLISELEAEFDIRIPAVEVIEKNFNSAQALCEMVERLMDEG